MRFTIGDEWPIREKKQNCEQKPYAHTVHLKSVSIGRTLANLRALKYRNLNFFRIGYILWIWVCRVSVGWLNWDAEHKPFCRRIRPNSGIYFIANKYNSFWNFMLRVQGSEPRGTRLALNSRTFTYGHRGFPYLFRGIPANPPIFLFGPE